MSLTIDKGTLGIWFTAFRHGPLQGDVLMTLERGVGGEYPCHVRLRFYDPADPGNDAFSEKDTKRWVRGTISADSDAAAVAQVRERALTLPGTITERGELLMESTPEELFERLQSQPWCHWKTIDPETDEVKDSSERRRKA